MLCIEPTQWNICPCTWVPVALQRQRGLCHFPLRWAPWKFCESADAGPWVKIVPVLRVVAPRPWVLMTAWTTSGNIRRTVVSISCCNEHSWPPSCCSCCCCCCNAVMAKATCCCSPSLSVLSIWREPWWLLGSKPRSSKALMMFVLRALIPLSWRDFDGSSSASFSRSCSLYQLRSGTDWDARRGRWRCGGWLPGSGALPSTLSCRPICLPLAHLAGMLVQRSWLAWMVQGFPSDNVPVSMCTGLLNWLDVHWKFLL